MFTTWGRLAQQLPVSPIAIGDNVFIGRLAGTCIYNYILNFVCYFIFVLLQKNIFADIKMLLYFSDLGVSLWKRHE